MNKFEVVTLYSPELSSSILNTETEKLKNIITKNNGKFVNEENWGLRDLSYNINKFKKAFYRFFQIETSGSIVKEINMELNQSENLIRYIFIKVKNHQALPTKLNDEKK